MQPMHEHAVTNTSAVCDQSFVKHGAATICNLSCSQNAFAKLAPGQLKVYVH